MAAHAKIVARHPGVGLLAVTSPGRLFAGWRKDGAKSHVARLLGDLAPGARLVAVIDGHPGALAWLGAVKGQPLMPLGVDAFGQCGTIPDLYRAYGIDVAAIEEAFAKI